LTRIEGQVNGQAPSADRSVACADPKGKPADDTALQAADGSFDRVLTRVAAKERRLEEGALKPSEAPTDPKGRPVDGAGVQSADGSFHRLLTRVAGEKLGLDGETLRGHAPTAMDEQVDENRSLPDSIEGLADGARPGADRLDPFVDSSDEGSARENELAAGSLLDVSPAPIPTASVAVHGDARFLGPAVAERKVQRPITGVQDASLPADWPRQDLAGGVFPAEDGARLFTQVAAVRETSSDGTIVMKVAAAVLDQQTHLPPVGLAPIDQILSRIVAQTEAVEPTEQNSGLGSSNGALMAGNAAEPLPGTLSVVKILSLRLEPAHLGAVTIRMRLSGSNLGLEVETEQAGTADLLAEESAHLAEKLRASGYSLEKLVIKSTPRPFLSPGGEGVFSGEHGAQAGLFDLDIALPVNAQNGEQGGNGRRQPGTHASPPDDAADASDAPAAPHLHGARFV
jgi:hypothetical protein